MKQYTLKKIFKFIKPCDIWNVVICLLVSPAAFITKLFIRGFWLVCEEKNEARDNGYWFFKYVRENHPKQKIAYAINKKSPDYKKVENLGKVISYGSLSHWFWYIVADKNVSSQKGGKPNAAACYLFEVVFKLRKHNRVFLQHGVTKDDAKWLYYENCYFDKFICATKPEHEFISDKFGYDKDRLALTGFARFDNLNDDMLDKDLILIMPSWRNWLGRESSDNKHMIFEESDYFKCWNEFVSSEKLSELLKKYKKHAIFYPHRNMQKFISSFKTADENIVIADWRDYDVQDLLKRAALLITDYSSVFFDFAYMCKPIIFYQFDEAEFREKQYQQGYFDYHNTPLGSFADNEIDLLNQLENKLENGLIKNDEQIVKAVFGFTDNRNCERIYNAIKADRL